MAYSDSFVVRDRRPGYLRVDNVLYDRFGAVLGPYGLAVYMALCRYVNQDSECYPSYATIARGTGMSRRQVIREVAKLGVLGVIAIEHRVESKRHTSNIFILLDTSDSQSPPLVTPSHHPSDSQSPKQSLINKITHRGVNKGVNSSSEKRNYHPDEFRGFILG